MSDGNRQRAEVAHLFDQIREEYEAAMRRLTGSSRGTSRDSFIITRMENMGQLQAQIEELMEENAGELVVQALEKTSAVQVSHS